MSLMGQDNYSNIAPLKGQMKQYIIYLVHIAYIFGGVKKLFRKNAQSVKRNLRNN